MRTAAIFGPGNLSKYVNKFRGIGNTEWISRLPPSSNDADVVIVFGGDGTVHRYLSRFVTLGLPVLVVPCGSGNDFARALNLRNVRDALAAWRTFTESGDNLRTIDLGIIKELGETNSRADDASAPHNPYPRYFCCVAGVGIDGEIARRANALPRWLRAHGGYAFCAPREFIRFAPFPMKLSVEGANSPHKPTLLAAFANASTYGGGMKIAPLAQLDDGKLDVCIVRGMDPLKLFCLFPTVYFGRHLGFREVEYCQTERAAIETEHPRDVYADGEYVCRTPVEFGVARNALQVIVPQ